MTTVSIKNAQFEINANNLINFQPAMLARSTIPRKSRSAIFAMVKLSARMPVKWALFKLNKLKFCKFVSYNKILVIFDQKYDSLFIIIFIVLFSVKVFFWCKFHHIRNYLPCLVASFALSSF